MICQNNGDKTAIFPLWIKIFLRSFVCSFISKQHHFHIPFHSVGRLIGWLVFLLHRSAFCSLLLCVESFSLHPLALLIYLFKTPSSFGQRYNNIMVSFTKHPNTSIAFIRWPFFVSLLPWIYLFGKLIVWLLWIEKSLCLHPINPLPSYISIHSSANKLLWFIHFHISMVAFDSNRLDCWQITNFVNQIHLFFFRIGRISHAN